MPFPDTSSRQHPRIVTRLPADLAKLRERFLGAYPGEADRVELLARVPSALRHVLSLRLELDRADALPRRYRDLAAKTLRGEAESGNPDAVEQLVISYATAVRGGRQREAIALMPRLRRFFTEPQIIELVLTLTLTRAFLNFDAMLGVPPAEEGQASSAI